MKSLQQWLDAYGESHQNSTNRKIHKIAVPGIYLSIVGLIWCLPQLPLGGMSINWVWVVMLPVMVFYFRLSRSVFIQMLIFTLACLAIITFTAMLGVSVLTVCIGMFVVLWIMQFVGHKIEGKKPSFFDDLQFLLIGPIWVFRQK
ncbi:DUF962 domain-containing protein [Vibrio mediterranei]|jgi:uncharacterized membrane protein YGL010W|uniref:DUF962 domain-containing protein n=1 Tax=Vibrio barjaei TaxID=1676683 RepID=A0ABW7IPJ8_9VIBR|nr:Mpo1-like protein [Vibrio barjaei]MCG9788034.1 DUF962 domain-containing protein [Vibrio mediterranei]OIN27467.1 hypothetical protein AWH66_2012275 [Vibrio barjaei]